MKAQKVVRLWPYQPYMWAPTALILDTLGTVLSVLIERGVLISGVVLYTSLCSWNNVYSGVLIKGNVLISEVSL